MKFTPTNRHNPCPICTDITGDCRHLDNGLILCHDYIDRDADVAGFLWRKSSSCGVWGVFSPNHAQNVYDPQVWARQRELIEARISWERSQKFKNALSADERDRAIRKLHKYIGLSNRDRSLLRARGLTNQQIDEDLYFSIAPDQPIPCSIPLNLPGVHPSGRKLATIHSGYACVIFDARRRAIGWQMRLDNVTKGGKYRWAKGTVSSHLQGGELPITIRIPELITSRAVWALEGVVKPGIAHRRLGVKCLGAAGGNFRGSPNQVKTVVQDATEVIICPDAGDVINPHVMKRWQIQLKFFKSLSKTVKFAWWGQITKDVGDIDEISPETLREITYLTLEQFFEIAQKEQRWQEVIAAQKKLNRLTYPVDLLLDERYLPNLQEQIPRSGIINLNSHKGSGKSAQIKLIKDFFIQLGYNIISITPRIALGREQAQKWEIEWIDDSEIPGINKLTLLENQQTIGLCWDSLGKLFHRDWSKTVVIIDEAELGVFHLATSSTCRDRRPFILRTFEEKIKECLDNQGLVILSDADLTDIPVDYVRSFCPDAPVYTILNIHRPQSWEIDFYTGKVDEVLDQIFEAVESGRKIAVPTDCQAQAEALDEELDKRFPNKKIVRIDRTITATDFGRNFVERPNESIMEIQPDVLIYTPSMGVGVSIDVEWFERVYGLFFGVLEPSQCRQTLARIRAAIPRIVWAAQRGFIDDDQRSFLPEQINKRLFSSREKESTLIDIAKVIVSDDADDDEIMEVLMSMWNRETKSWDNPHINLYCQLVARRNFSKSQLALQLRQELIDEGHHLTDWAAEQKTAIGSDVTQMKEELKEKQAVAIATAPEITLEQAVAIRQKATNTEQERHQADKAFLQAELPGVELTPEFVYRAVIKDQRRWLNRVKLFWYLQHQDVTKDLNRLLWRHKLKQFAHGVVYLPDLKTLSYQVKVLSDLGLFKLIDLDNPDKNYSQEDLEVKQFLKRAYKQRRDLYLAFGLTLTRKTEAIELINRLLKLVGLRLRYYRRETIARNRVRLYRIDEKLSRAPHRIAVLDSLTRKYVQPQSGEEIQPVHNSPIDLNNTDKLWTNKGTQSINTAPDTERVDTPTKQTPPSSEPEESVSQLEADKYFDSEQGTKDIAEILEFCDTPETFGLIRQTVGFTKERLIRAARLLLPDKRSQLFIWGLAP